MDEAQLDSIGFMFDAQHSKTSKSFSFSNKIDLQVSLIDNDPGHVQSGLYLWPAAEYACEHIINKWTSFEHQIESVLELGAGCGLTGKVNLFCNYT